jgi:hypothetical protein
MDAIRSPRGRARSSRTAPPRSAPAVARRGAAFALVASALIAAASPAHARPPLRDEPVAWHAADRGDIPAPKERDPSLLRDQFEETVARPVGRFFNPVRLARHVGGIFGTEIAHSAADINALDEALNSTWFTNRIGVYAMTPEDVARGPVTDGGPDRSAPWRVTRAKTQGVTPGFNIQDGRGRTFVIKFDAPCCPGGPSAAGVVTGRLLHAAGYNVPEDFVVTFRREEVVVGENVTFTDRKGAKRTMLPADLDSLLAAVTPQPDGSYRAIASRFLDGKPIGPFDWKGRRRDDPFDRVKHENRRELRGLRMIAAWLAHFDMKQHNTLDMWVEDGGRRYVKHYLIDFASTLGMGAMGPFPLANMEYGFDISAISGRLFSLGIHEDDWRRLERPAELPEVGYFEAEHFDPMEWKPLQPNAAFANLTERDGYWAAKVVSAFRDEHIRAAVAEGKYRDPEAAAYVARTLAARRDKIARYWFDRVAPLDFFRWESGTLRFQDLGAARDLYPGTTPRYRVRLAACDAERNAEAWTPWSDAAETRFDLAGPAAAPPGRDASADRRPFLALETSVDRGSGWSRPIRVYVARATGRVVAVDR